jgi:DNA polymerase-3 subunit epsilon
VRDKLHAYLLERPAGATARELIDLVFMRPGSDPEFAPRFLHALLGDDPRFAFDRTTGRWTAAAHADLAQSLADAHFVVVDLETAGGAPVYGEGIIEIGALRLHAGRIVDQFQALVDPGRRVPTFITQLTGITDDMLAGCAAIDAVLPRFVDFAADSVLVAHNAAFDFAYLDAARLRLDGAVFAQQRLCTLRLARRLLPQLRRRSLDALAGHFGIPLVDRHRALGDARITAELFFHLLELLRARDIVRLDQLLDLQDRAADGARFICLLPRASVARLPHTPGIYRFTGEDGGLLYIGKAKNLRQRVGSYLYNSSTHRRTVLDLIRRVRNVEVEPAGSELEAALREAEEIRRCRPPYNRLGKHLPQIAFVKLTTGDPFPRLAVVRRLGRRGRYFGPFRSRPSAQHAQALLARLFRVRLCPGRLRPSADATPCLQGQIGACSIPCAARVTREDYAGQVAAVESFFNGESAHAEADLIQRRDAHSAAQRFEAAARAQRDLELVRRIHRRQRTLGWIVARQHFMVMQPVADRDHALLYAVLHGRLSLRAALRTRAELAAFAARLAPHLATTHAPVLQAEEVDGTVIVAAWLRDRGERDGYVFSLDPAVPPEGQLPEWGAALDSLLARGAEPDPHARAAKAQAPPGPER